MVPVPLGEAVESYPGSRAGERGRQRFQGEGSDPAVHVVPEVMSLFLPCTTRFQQNLSILVLVSGCVDRRTLHACLLLPGNFRFTHVAPFFVDCRTHTCVPITTPSQW